MRIVTSEDYKSLRIGAYTVEGWLTASVHNRRGE